MIELLSLIAFLLIAFSIGSNDTSNAFGICIGCRIISIRKASLLLFFLVLSGLIFQGNKVIKTVGENLVTTNMEISAVSLTVSAIIVVIANLRGIPVSTHQVIVGSLSGAGIAFGANFSFKTLCEIVLSWLLSPIVAGILSVLLFISIERFSKRLGLLEFERWLEILLICSGMLISYNMGANELATAIAPLVATDAELGSITFFGAVAITLGALLLARRIAETLCKGIASVDPRSGFSAQFGAGISVYLFTVLGMPVSTTYSLVGGILAVGLFKSVKTLKVKKIKEIAISWFSAPLVAFFLGYISSKIFLGV
ncbi:MAG: inorganic phosphate transporter, PiT family [Archaeoglobaceae archaeon]|nr:inorganic phosphate transporter, PiT family [Archaeoglobaceae archaeon]